MAPGSKTLSPQASNNRYNCHPLPSPQTYKQTAKLTRELKTNYQVGATANKNGFTESEILLQPETLAIIRVLKLNK